jgi:hypothetical protein
VEDCRVRQSFNRWPTAPIGARFTVVVQCDPIGAPGRALWAARLRNWSLAPQKVLPSHCEHHDEDRRRTRQGAWRTGARGPAPLTRLWASG